MRESKRRSMSIYDLARTLPAECQESFLLFVETGEANESYLKHVEIHPTCKSAINEAYEITVAKLQKLGKLIKKIR